MVTLPKPPMRLRSLSEVQTLSHWKLGSLLSSDLLIRSHSGAARESYCSDFPCEQR